MRTGKSLWTEKIVVRWGDMDALNHALGKSEPLPKRVLDVLH